MFWVNILFHPWRGLFQASLFPSGFCYYQHWHVIIATFWNSLSLVSSSAGSVPATGFLKQSSIHMDSKGFITVNKVFCQIYSRCDPVVSCFYHFTHFNILPDDADKCWRSLCRRGCGDFSLSSTKQQEGEHPSLANGSCTRWVCNIWILRSPGSLWG